MAHSFSKGCYFTSLDDIKGKHITVMGLGLNGGGEACVRFFLKDGAYVLAPDMKTEEHSDLANTKLKILKMLTVL